MIAAPPRVRLLLAAVLTVGGLVLHEIVQALSEGARILEARLESGIPFLPWSIWVYLAFFPLIGWAALRVEQALFWRFVGACVIAALVAWSVVLLYPLSFARPDPASIASAWYREIFTLVHAADPAHISFPSLHVAVTWVCCFTLWASPGRARRLALCCAISLSTLTTKQHLVLDAVGGIALAWLSVELSKRVSARLVRRA